MRSTLFLRYIKNTAIYRSEVEYSFYLVVWYLLKIILHISTCNGKYLGLFLKTKFFYSEFCKLVFQGTSIGKSFSVNIKLMCSNSMSIVKHTIAKHQLRAEWNVFWRKYGIHQSFRFFDWCLEFLEFYLAILPVGIFLLSLIRRY